MGGIWFNFLYGDQDGTLDEDVDPIGTESAGTLFQADVTAGWNLTESFYLGVNASIQSTDEGEVVNAGGVDGLGNETSSFMGLALYPKLTLSENFALGLRAEYFSVKSGHLGIFGLDDNGDGSVMEFTLSGNYKVGGFTFIPEFRIDKTAEDSFYEDGDAELKDMMATVNLAAVYKF
jgi:hypothetical protein